VEDPGIMKKDFDIQPIGVVQPRSRVFHILFRIL